MLCDILDVRSPGSVLILDVLLALEHDLVGRHDYYVSTLFTRYTWNRIVGFLTISGSLGSTTGDLRSALRRDGNSG